MSANDQTSFFARLRQSVRRLFGRHRFDDLAARLDHLSGLVQALSEHRDRQEESRLGELGARMTAIEEVSRAGEWTQSFAAIKEAQKRMITESRKMLGDAEEQSRADAVVLRQAVAECAASAGRVERRIEALFSDDVLTDKKGKTWIAQLREQLLHLEGMSSNTIERLEERHGEWLTAQQVLQRALQDVQDRITAAWNEVDTMRGRLSDADERERSLADQASHLLELLGQARRELGETRERAEEADESRAARHDLESELRTAQGDLEILAAELEEAREAYESFSRWKQSAQSEAERLKRERDALLKKDPESEPRRRGGGSPKPKSTGSAKGNGKNP